MIAISRQAGVTIGLVVICIVLAVIANGQSANQTTKTAKQPAGLQHVIKPSRPLKPAPEPYTFPAGGRTLMPNYRMVALYGSPSYPVLGALGEQPLEASIARAKQLAVAYQPYSQQPILPTFEIITTVASAEPTENGDYSREVDISTIWPWVTAARDAGVYVVLDLQPGHSDFLTQAKQYEALLREPNVGLALDAEWRLGPGKQHLVNIGSVSIDEVNQTADWLATLTAQNKLPQKLLLLHEFRLDMIQHRELLDTSHPQLAYAIQMDGQGTQQVKRDTWRSVTASPPPNTYFGWKNFYKKDTPMLTPDATMAITPAPWYISYQ